MNQNMDYRQIDIIRDRSSVTFEEGMEDILLYL